MNRTGVVIALSVAAVVGLVFGLFPRFDLGISALFFDPATQSFINDQSIIGRFRWPGAARGVGMWIVTALAMPAAVTLVLKLIVPGMRLAIPARAAVMLLATLALGPGIMANLVLKEHWGRSRPIDVREFAGTDRFVAWWDPRGDCPHNCSFVAGEGAGAFWTLAPAALAPPMLRPLAYAAAIAFGAGVGTLRIAFGGHFFTDVVFSGVFTFLIIWVVHGALYRWPWSAISDAQLETGIERLVERVRRRAGRALLGLLGLLRRIGRSPSGV